MSIGNVRRAAAFLLLLVTGIGAARIASAQDAAGVLETLRQQLGEPPRTFRLMGAGSGYDPAPDDGARRHYRIERWSLEWDLEGGTAVEEVVRAASSSGGDTPREPRAETRTAAAETAEAPWRERYLYWMAPHTFLAGARAHGARLETRTIERAEHRVVAFTPPGGAPVIGFIDGDGRLERIRTEIGDTAGRRSTREVVFFGSDDLSGSADPDILIEKHDGELARVLVIREADGAGGQADGAGGGEPGAAETPSGA